MRILFDTNVILDLLLERSPYLADAAALFAAVHHSWLTGLLCATTITTIHYIGRQTHGPAKTRAKLRQLLAMFTVAPVTQSVLLDALDLDFTDFEVAVHEAACAAEAVGIVTRNTHDFRHSRIRIYTPRELVTILRTLHP